MIEIIREGLITLTAPPLGTPTFVRKAPPVHIDTYALIYFSKCPKYVKFAKLKC